MEYVERDAEPEFWVEERDAYPEAYYYDDEL